MDLFQDYLETRWQEGQRNGLQLWTEIKRLGFQGSKATVSRWTAARKEATDRSAKFAVAAAIAPELCMAPERRPDISRRTDRAVLVPSL